MFNKSKTSIKKLTRGDIWVKQTMILLIVKEFVNIALKGRNASPRLQKLSRDIYRVSQALLGLLSSVEEEIILDSCDKNKGEEDARLEEDLWDPGYPGEE